MPLATSCLLIIVASVGCEPRNAFVAPPPPEVTVAQPVTAQVAETLDFTGTTEARQVVQLRARVTGYLNRLAFEDGAQVKEGDLLFVIEQAPFEADVDLAKANLQKAVAQEQLAQANLNRALELQKSRAIAKQDVESNTAELATSAANVKAAEAALRKATLDLNYTEIRAPISGRIGRHLVDIGNLVNKEQTELAVIENIDPIFVYFDVSESVFLRYAALVRERKVPDPTVTPLVLKAALQNEKGFPHQGYLDFTDLGIDPSSGTIRRRGVFPNSDGLLLSGLFMRIRTEIGDPTPRLLVEERAIGTDQRGSFVLVVDEKNKVEYRPVKLGLQTDSLRVIEEGIEASDWIIVNGMQRALPGSQVRPVREAMRSADSPADANASPPAANEAEQEKKSATTQGTEGANTQDPPQAPPATPTGAASSESSSVEAAPTDSTTSSPETIEK
jgi:RND family efflux transporter MFP subunit